MILACLAACQQANKNELSNAGKKTESREDSLYHQTMDIHKEVMAEMGKLIGYQKQLQHQVDSLNNYLKFNKLPRNIAEPKIKQIDSLTNSLKKLQFADSAMNAWMEQFNPDPQLASSDANADYFEKQKNSAEAMKVIFFKALKDAEDLFTSPK